MLHQDKNDKGGLYQFDDNQLDKVRSAIKINNKNNLRYTGLFFFKNNHNFIWILIISISLSPN
jgi:hypothetical protein